MTKETAKAGDTRRELLKKWKGSKMKTVLSKSIKASPKATLTSRLRQQLNTPLKASKTLSNRKISQTSSNLKKENVSPNVKAPAKRPNRSILRQAHSTSDGSKTKTVSFGKRPFEAVSVPSISGVLTCRPGLKNKILKVHETGKKSAVDTTVKKKVDHLKKSLVTPSSRARVEEWRQARRERLAARILRNRMSASEAAAVSASIFGVKASKSLKSIPLAQGLEETNLRRETLGVPKVSKQVESHKDRRHTVFGSAVAFGGKKPNTKAPPMVRQTLSSQLRISSRQVPTSVTSVLNLSCNKRDMPPPARRTMNVQRTLSFVRNPPTKANAQGNKLINSLKVSSNSAMKKSAHVELKQDPVRTRKSLSTLFRRGSAKLAEEIKHEASLAFHTSFPGIPSPIIEEQSPVSTFSTESTDDEIDFKSFESPRIKEKCPTVQSSAESMDKEIIFKTPLVVSVKTPAKRSGAFHTSVQRYSTPSHIAASPYVSEIREKLDKWLNSNNSSLNRSRHIQCFGHSVSGSSHTTSTGKSPSVKKMKLEPRVNIEYAKKQFGDASNITIDAECSTCEKVEAHVEEIVNDVQELLENGLPVQECGKWLDEIKNKCPDAAKLPNFWECRAHVEEAKGEIVEAVNCFQQALEHGVQKDDVCVGFTKFVGRVAAKENDGCIVSPAGVHLSPRTMKDDAVRKTRTPRKTYLDVANIFESSVIKYAFKQRNFKRLIAALGINESVTPYLLTPVRRSVRLQQLSSGSSPLSQNTCVTSLEELPQEIQKVAKVVPNRNLIVSSFDNATVE